MTRQFPIIYSYYNPPPQTPIKHWGGPSLTQQHFKEECDINNILRKFTETGILPSIGPGSYEDLTQTGDYREAMETIMQAQEAFSLMPAEIRKQFGNDPGQFMDFVHNPTNLEKGRELGIFSPAPPAEKNPNPIHQNNLNPNPAETT